MNRDHWQKVKKIFDAALKLAPEQRGKFLDEKCVGDKILRREVEKLLASFADDSFMEQPAAAELAGVIIRGGTAHPEAGKCFGHYEIIRQIGAGGMGEVYLAEDKKLDRRVAVKILNENFAGHESNLRRFTQEAKAASALNHPNILVIYEIGEAGETNYIVSEFIEGVTLREVIEMERPLPDGNVRRPETGVSKLSEVLDIAIQIANALAAAHAAHIVHRDVKPENIMIRPDGYVKILDFGLAKLVEQKQVGLEELTVKQNETAKGIILGTVNYMSPEQAKGEKVDGRTDIFSFGAVVYEMIAGRTPFAGDSASETFANLINAAPPPLSRFAENVPDELQRIIAKMLRKNKDERYQTMKDLLIDLKNLQKRLEFEAELLREGETGRWGKEEKRSSGEEENITKIQVFPHPSVSPSSYLSVSSSPLLSSIAVLPFSTFGLKEDEVYLGLGLADALITQLSQTRQLTVRPTNAVRHLSGARKDAAKIGRELRVGAILEGNLQRSGENLRLTVQLVNTETDTMLWAEKFNIRFTDFFEVQDVIAEQVSRALLLKFSSEERERLTKRYTENNAAYLEYLRGRYFWNKRDAESFQKAIRHFKAAIDLDPTFALAYAGLADTYSSLPIWGAGAARDFYPRARAAALRALEIDDRLAEAHASSGYVKYLYDWDFAGVETSYRRAIELNPNYATVRAWFGKFLVTMQRFDEALIEMKQADKLDPLSPQIGAAFGGLYLYSRQYDKAVEQYDRVLDENPNLVPALFGLGMAYAQKGMFAEAVAAHEKAVEHSAQNPVLIGTLAGTRAMAGEREAALKTIEELKPEYEKCEMLSYSIATVYARLNEKPAAFEWLEKAYAERNSQLPDLDIDPEFDNLRDDSRFEDLRRRIGLPQ